MKQALPQGLMVLALAAVLGGCAGVLHPSRGAPLSPEARAYVDSVFVIMRARALAQRPLDWDELRRQTLERAGGARTPHETHEALQWALKRVNAHSELILPESWAKDEKEWHRNPEVPSGRMLDGGVAYIMLPPYASADPVLGGNYAAAGQALIADFSDRRACGWILDLRRNWGGNMYPMLVAIGPLLGDGPAGFFRAGSGMIKGYGYAADGSAWLGTDTIARLPRGMPSVPPLAEPPVAVLTGPITASSAEALVVAFRGVPRARSFGAPTAGFSTGNTGYPMSDGAVVLLTELVLGDRLTREYGKEIRPDREVGGSIVNMFADPEDVFTTRLATQWLRSRPECRARPKAVKATPR